MTLRMMGYVEFERTAEGYPIEGTDRFVPAHDRGDYRPLPGTHYAPVQRTHVDEFERRFTYGELEPVLARDTLRKLPTARQLPVEIA